MMNCGEGSSRRLWRGAGCKSGGIRREAIIGFARTTAAGRGRGLHPFTSGQRGAGRLQQTEPSAGQQRQHKPTNLGGRQIDAEESKRQEQFASNQSQASGRGIGSYAAKLELAQQQGRGIDPSQVNQLHPESIAKRLQTRSALAAEQPSNEETSDPELDDVEDEMPWEEDEDLGALVDDEDGDDDDPWGMSASLEETLKSHRRAGSSRDEDTLPSQNPGQSPWLPPQVPASQTWDDLGFNNQADSSTTAARRRAGSQASTSAPAGSLQPKRGLGDVMQRRKARPTGGFEALITVGKEALKDAPADTDQASTSTEDSSGNDDWLSQTAAWPSQQDMEELPKMTGWSDSDSDPATRQGASNARANDWMRDTASTSGWYGDNGSTGWYKEEPTQPQSQRTDQSGRGTGRGKSRAGRSSRGKLASTSRPSSTGYEERDQLAGSSRDDWSSGSGSGWYEGPSDWSDRGNNTLQTDSSKGRDRPDRKAVSPSFDSRISRAQSRDRGEGLSKNQRTSPQMGQASTDPRRFAQSLKPHTPKAAGRPAQFQNRRDKTDGSPSGVAEPVTQEAAQSLRERLTTLAGRKSFSSNAFGKSFYKAAAALQDRLTVGVQAEVQAAIDAQQRQYRRRTVKQLREAGVIITDLQGINEGTIFNDFVWVFRVAPDSVLNDVPLNGVEDSLDWSLNDPDQEHSKGAAAEIAADKTALTEEAAVPPKPLPNHVFKKGDAVLLLHTLWDGSLPDFSDQYQSLQGTIIGLGRSFIKIAVSRDVHEQLEEAGTEKRWRMDRTVQEITSERQLQAISLLDKPFAHLERKEEFRTRKAQTDPEQPVELIGDEEQNQAAEDQRNKEQGIVSKEFRVGELRVRQILLGDPESFSAAQAPPTWASSEEWRKEAKKWLTELGLKDESTRLNKSQIMAIAKSLSSTLTLWQGPPGTGKTRTLLVLLHILCKLSEFSKGSRNDMGPILACADTNAATDNILEGLVAKGVKVVRVGRPVSVREELRDATLESLAHGHRLGKKAMELREEADAVFKERREGGGLDRNTCSKDEWELMRDKLMKKGQRLERDSRQMLIAAQQQILAQAEVVTATCTGAGDYTLLQNMRFRVVVLDEASQSTEPSTLIPLLRGAESVVMAGDPKQLPPTVVSELGLKCDLDRTLFERLTETGVEPWLLDTQYRMHPAIANFPNELFYAGNLKSGITAADRPAPKGFPWPNPDCPVALVECDHGREMRAGFIKGGKLSVSASIAPGASSFCNVEEAQLAIRAFEMLMSAGDAESGAILTPYNGQVKVIRNLIKMSGIKDKIVVSSVDGYQGREADIIVFSAVRNNLEGRLGFVTDERRLNVAITRPRRGLVVVGAPDTLSADERWRRWMTWVRDRGGLLAPEALLLTAGEKMQGVFDPSVDAVGILVEQRNLETSAAQGAVIDADDPDEQALAAFGGEAAGLVDPEYDSSYYMN